MEGKGEMKEEETVHNKEGSWSMLVRELREGRELRGGRKRGELRGGREGS